MLKNIHLSTVLQFQMKMTDKLLQVAVAILRHEIEIGSLLYWHSKSLAYFDIKTRL